MGRDSLVIGVAALATGYAVWLPTPWLAVLAPVAFVAIIETVQRVCLLSTWSGYPGRWSSIVRRVVAARR
jgi:hypothetical protein